MLRKVNPSKTEIIDIGGIAAVLSIERTPLHEHSMPLQNLMAHAICNGTSKKLVDQRSAAQ